MKVTLEINGRKVTGTIVSETKPLVVEKPEYIIPAATLARHIEEKRILFKGYPGWGNMSAAEQEQAAREAAIEEINKIAPHIGLRVKSKPNSR